MEHGDNPIVKLVAATITFQRADGTIESRTLDSIATFGIVDSNAVAIVPRRHEPGMIWRTLAFTFLDEGPLATDVEEDEAA